MMKFFPRKLVGRFKNLRNELRTELSHVKGEITKRRALRLERKALRKFEKQQRKERENLDYAERRALRTLEQQLNNEEREAHMFARIADGGVTNVGEARLFELRRKGIETAYDVYQAGVRNLTNINSIGPGIAERLYEWALMHQPEEIVFDPDDPSHAARLNALTQAYLGNS